MVSDAGLENTFKYLLPPEYLENESINEYVKLSEKVGPSTGFVYCFVNLEGNPKEFRFKRLKSMDLSG